MPQSLIRLNGFVMSQYDVVPSPRSAPDAGLSLEDVVARIADLVLKADRLAERYEHGLGHLTEPAALAQQQARVRALRSCTERGRDRLIEIGQRD
jgi:hypothetical protein